MVDVVVLVLLVLAESSTYGHTETCKVHDKDRTINAMEGEALCVPALQGHMEEANVTEFTWFRHGPDNTTQELTLSEEEQIHHHGPVLFFLPLSIHHSAHYSAYWRSATYGCHMFVMWVVVYPASPFNHSLLYVPVSEDSASNVDIPCPVEHLCQDGNGHLTWFKNFSLIAAQRRSPLWVNGASKADEALYTCVCTWRHGGGVYNTSASMMLEVTAPSASHPPLIISPPSDNSTETTALGSSIKLICSAFCGENNQDECHLWWEMNGLVIRWKTGYSVNFTKEQEASKLSISKAVLTIDRVSHSDFHSQFKCKAMNDQRWISAVVYLRPRVTMVPHIIAWVCVVLLFLLAALVVKHFAIDLALLSRRVFTHYGRPEDGKVYDAYVVYQMQGNDPATEERVGDFVTRVLPSVLEHKCGLRLFIHGRDDLPGEDRMELVEPCMRLSRRLMVILTPGSGSIFEEYDRQVGLHQALVHSEMSVILIQLGVVGQQGYTHLPPGLQHLVRKSAPLRWEEGQYGSTTPDSAFWKRVRYMMPAPRHPATVHSPVHIRLAYHGQDKV